MVDQLIVSQNPTLSISLVKLAVYYYFRKYTQAQVVTRLSSTNQFSTSLMLRLICIDMLSEIFIVTLFFILYTIS
jgi:hypothetical protein